jgi:hypothetical protein
MGLFWKWTTFIFFVSLCCGETSGANSPVWPPVLPHISSPLDNPSFHVAGKDVVSENGLVVIVGSIGRMEPSSAEAAQSADHPIFVDASHYRTWARGFDFSGRMIWERTYDGPQQLLPNAVAALPDGFLMAGDQQKNKKCGFTGWLSRLDTKGNEIWRQDVGSFNNTGNNTGNSTGGLTGLSDVAVSQDQMIAAGGSREGQGWIVLLDGSGKIVWEKTFPEINNVTSLFFHKNTIIAAGVSTNTSSMGKSRLIALSVSDDASGALLWTTLIDEGEISALAPAKDGGVAVGTGQEERQLLRSALVVRFRADGKVLSKRLLENSPGMHDQANDVAIAKNGDVIVAGEEFPVESSGQRFPKVWRLSREGSIKKSRVYESGADYNYVDAIAVDREDRLTLVGLSSFSNTKTTRPLVLHLESGTLDPVTSK